ncbi:C2 domain protein (macronuclear) [Tetrahymena thermophila SB210]|uniref:C2 domain protein n=1 Tax=Tetrahymena thermophila (strain SB210) TaxID=312017 RepID=Q22YY2_TETTS|nr:C2 domain protein [Tetrahymena thermophila SB210]EAR90539.1 C2 domain protein [Tetrahymena thermophila SB210]|eukprot:XP_001010784.1 C2 domain protein [Tetrahymena thermophila SB210]
MSYSANQVKNPNGKLTVWITKADIYNTSQSYENIIVKIQIGNDVKITPACPYNQKNIQWVDGFEVVRKENEDNFLITLINQSKKGDEVLGSASIEINQFLQRARKTDFQADLQLNGKNTSSLQTKIQFVKFTDAENLALEAQKQAQSGKKVDGSKIQETAINEASKKLRENEILTNYSNNPYAQSYKYLITITNIKANFKRDTDLFSKMDPFVRIKVSEDINFKTSIIKGGGKTPEWKEQVQVYVGLEEVIMFLAFDQEVHKDQLIGFGSVLMQNFKLGEETKVIPLEYHKQSAGELTITVNCKLVGSYEKSNNLLGKVVLRNVSSVLKKGQSNHQLKFSLGTENKCTHLITKSEPNNKYRDIIVFPIKDKNLTNLTINFQTVSSKNVDLVGSTLFDLKPVIENEKWYIQEEIIMIGKDKKEIGKIYADVQYVDLAEHDDEKLYKLQQNQGKVTLKNMRGYLTRDTEMFGKMDPYCILKYNGIQLKTSVHQSGGKEPVWKDNIFELPQFTYQKDKKLFFEVFDEDTSKDDLIGKGYIDLTQFIQKKGKYLGQKVNIEYEGKQAGQVNFDLEYEENQELIAYIEKKKKEKELEELQKKKAEEEMKALKAKQDAEKKKKEDEEKKQKEEEEKKRKLLEEQELKKKQEEEEKKKKLQEEQELKKKQEEEEKKKKLLEEQELKKKQEEEQKKKKLQEEQELKKKQEEEEKKKKLQEEQELKKKQEEEEKKKKLLEEQEQKKKQEEEQKKKLQQEQELKKKQEEDDKKKKLQEEQELKKKQEEDEKKKKLLEEQELKKKKDEDEKQKKKLQEEQELKKKQEEEERQKKEAEEKKKQEALQKEMELKKQNEELERARVQQENEEKRKQQEQEQKRLQENQNKSREQSPQGSQYSQNYAEYKVAKQNLEQGHGFGMSEYQSATSLQKSIPAFSMPRSQRFKPSSSVKREQSKGPDYVQLPSIFEQNQKKGVSFGHGQRGQRENSNSPGPGAYQKEISLRTVKGFTFGVSRSSCKNYIDPEFASPKKTQKFESAEKSRKQNSSFDNRTMEYEPKQNDIYIQQNKYLQQQQYNNNNNKRNASHDQRRNVQQQNIFNQNQNNNNRYMPQIRQQSVGQAYNQNNNHSNIVHSNHRHGNYHYTAPNDKNNKSYIY